MPTDEPRKIRHITKIVFFCGKCNRIIGKDLVCKHCKIEFSLDDLDDIDGAVDYV